nr:prepilin peptidase [Candidatus Levybacteria bacterium]
MITASIFLIGLFVGSFLGVLVDRIPKKKNFIKGRSHCENCKKELGVLDLIPVLSFIFLKGKCRYCHARLPYFYPIIEICTGIIFALTYIFLILNSQFSIFNPLSLITLLYYLLIVSSFIVIFFTDLKYGIIPDKIIFLAIAVNIFYLLIFNSSFLILHLVSGFGAFIFFVLISYIFFSITKKQGMGGGDIKLSFLLGLFLGFPGIIVALYLAFLTGGVLSIILIVWKKKAFLKDTLPFGPFLIAGTVISLFWGNQIYLYALSLLGM